MNRGPGRESNERGFANLFHAAYELEREQQAKKQQDKHSNVNVKERGEREEGR